VIRVTGGALRGRVLPRPVPEGVRPTAGRVREAVFSVVGQDLVGWSMIDLFGGSGLMAIEAASRGAAPVTVVEQNPRAAEAIRANAAGMGVALQVRVGDATRVQLEPADLVYVDPPYRQPIGPHVLRAAELCRRFVVAEARSGADWPEPPPGFERDRIRNYGDTEIALYVRIGTLSGSAEDDEVREDTGVIEDNG
jgi:16S rRNA (guanine966-N2)-methyltransferase